MYVLNYNFSDSSLSLPYLPSRPLLVLQPSLFKLCQLWDSTNLSGLSALELGWHVCKLGLWQPSAILEAIFLKPKKLILNGLLVEVPSLRPRHILYAWADNPKNRHKSFQSMYIAGWARTFGSVGKGQKGSGVTRKKGGIFSVTEEGYL